MVASEMIIMISLNMAIVLRIVPVILELLPVNPALRLFILMILAALARINVTLMLTVMMVIPALTIGVKGQLIQILFVSGTI